jgi:hypothetical protein
MSVSVVVPSTLERPVLREALAAVLESAAALGPGAEVLLVTNRVAPGTTYTGPTHPMLRVLSSAPAGVSRARNTAVAAARNDTVLFVDDDIVVPPGWCADMYEALRSGPVAVVGAVRITVTGPVTSYMDHVRMFDARPMDSHCGSLRRSATAVVSDGADAVPGPYPGWIGGCAGYRRDLAPAGGPYDVENHPHAGEDSDFAVRLRAAGRSMGWLDTARAALHHVDEELTALLSRSIRDGRSSARMYHRFRSRALNQYVPSPWQSHVATRTGRPGWYRGFAEVDSVPVRAVFATLSLVWVTCVLTGYLEEMGRLAGHRLLSVDEDRLTAELSAIVDGVVAAQRVEPAVWRSPPVSFAADRPPPPVDAHVPVAAVAAAVNRHAPVGDPPPDRFLRELSRHDRSWLSRMVKEQERIAALWKALEPRRDRLTLEAVHAQACRAGLPLEGVCGYLDQTSAPT